VLERQGVFARRPVGSALAACQRKGSHRAGPERHMTTHWPFAAPGSGLYWAGRRKPAMAINGRRN